MSESDILQQVRMGAEPDFANLGNALDGVPNGKGVSLQGCDVANPSYDLAFEVAENETVRSKGGTRRAPVLLTRGATVNAELYLRGNGTDDPAFGLPLFDAFRSFFSVHHTHTVAHAVSAVVDSSNLTATDAAANGLTIGAGFSLRIPGLSRPYIGFVKNITPGAPDQIEFQPPMSAQQLAAAQAAGALSLRGGLTLCIGEGYADASSLMCEAIKKAYIYQFSGLRGSTINFEFETGQSCKATAAWQAGYTRHGSVYTGSTIGISDWQSATLATADSVEGLQVGRFVRVDYNDLTYYLQIQAIDGNDVTLQPGLPDAITAADPAPGFKRALSTSNTAPSGKWLKFLIGRVYADGQTRCVRMAGMQLDLQPAPVKCPNNAIGAVDMVSPDPECRISLEYSSFDDEPFKAFEQERGYSVFVQAADSGTGNGFAFFVPRATAQEAPVPDQGDDLTTLPVQLAADDYTGDGAPYDGSSPANTTARVFFEY